MDLTPSSRRALLRKWAQHLIKDRPMTRERDSMTSPYVLQREEDLPRSLSEYEANLEKRTALRLGYKSRHATPLGRRQAVANRLLRIFQPKVGMRLPHGQPSEGGQSA